MWRGGRQWRFWHPIHRNADLISHTDSDFDSNPDSRSYDLWHILRRLCQRCDRHLVHIHIQGITV